MGVGQGARRDYLTVSGLTISGAAIMQAPEIGPDMQITPDMDISKASGGFLSGLYHAPALPQSGKAVIVRACFDVARYTPDLFDALAIPCPARIQTAIAKRQAEFLAGRMMAKLAQQALNHTPCPIEIGPDRAPIWPDGLAGSISHARGFCASIAGPAHLGRVGIDIEALPKGRTLDAILATALSEPERALIQAPPAPLRTDTLAALCFSAKETLFKTLYPAVGRHFGFAAAELRALPGETEISLYLTQDLTGDLRRGARFDISYRLGASEVMTWLIQPPRSGS